MIYKWPEFEAINILYFFLFVIVSSILFIIIYYLKSLENKLYLKFINLVNQSKIPPKDYDDLKHFYEYYKANYDKWTRFTELNDKKRLFSRLLEWYPKYVDNTIKNRSFLRILNHFFYKLNTLEFSIKMINKNEPITIENNTQNIGFIIKINEKESTILYVKLLLEQNYEKEKQYQIVFYRPSIGEIQFKSKIHQINNNECYIYLEGEGSPTKEKIMTLKMVYGEVSFYHPELQYTSKKIPFIAEKTSLQGMKLEFKENIENFLKKELKNYLKTKKISLQDFILKLEFSLEKDFIEIEGKIIAKYKNELNKYLVAYRTNQTTEELLKIELIKKFIKSNNPVPEKL